MYVCIFHHFNNPPHLKARGCLVSMLLPREARRRGGTDRTERRVWRTSPSKSNGIRTETIPTMVELQLNPGGIRFCKKKSETTPTHIDIWYTWGAIVPFFFRAAQQFPPTASFHRGTALEVLDLHHDLELFTWWFGSHGAMGKPWENHGKTRMHHGNFMKYHADGK